MKIIVGISGASGSIYALALIRMLARQSVEVCAVLSEMGRRVMEYECGVTAEELSQWARVYDDAELFSPLASGSVLCDGMAIAPCSMHTLGAVAGGLADTLILRAAMVSLKERRKLVALVRETPLSLVQIENMAAFTRAGGIVMPACPGFYRRPTEIWELVEAMAARVMDLFGIPHDCDVSWKGGKYEK